MLGDSRVGEKSLDLPGAQVVRLPLLVVEAEPFDPLDAVLLGAGRVTLTADCISGPIQRPLGRGTQWTTR